MQKFLAAIDFYDDCSDDGDGESGISSDLYFHLQNHNIYYLWMECRRSIKEKIYLSILYFLRCIYVHETMFECFLEKQHGVILEICI